MMVASQIDSRTIIDTPGAEKLSGEGDMLLLSGCETRPINLQSFYFPDEDVVERVKLLNEADTQPPVETLIFEERAKTDSVFNAIDEDGSDDLFEDAKTAVIEAGKASTSYIQRKLRVGYSRAARLLDMLEERGVIGPADGSRPREVLGDDNYVDCVSCANQSFCLDHNPLLEIQYGLAKKAVIEKGKASTSFLQRQFKIGYARAAALIDLLEENGVIGPADGTRARKVLIPE
jgi:DNA segregation ATPase FtsK/SpoIIIE-like protein